MATIETEQIVYCVKIIINVFKSEQKRRGEQKQLQISGELTCSAQEASVAGHTMAL